MTFLEYYQDIIIQPPPPGTPYKKPFPYPLAFRPEEQSRLVKPKHLNHYPV